jgi:hypothetical protein
MTDQLLRDLDAGKPEVRDSLWMLLVLGQSFIRHKTLPQTANVTTETLPNTTAVFKPSPRLEGAA